MENKKVTQDKCEMLLGWLKDLEKEIFEMFHHLQLFHFTRDEILEKNQIVKSGNMTYLGWIMRSSTVDLIIRVARLCDDTKGTDSFVRFLRELEKSPECLTKERYVGLYEGSVNADSARHYFEDLAGDGAVRFPIEQIESDINILTKEEPLLGITMYRNEYVAHIAATKKRLPPDYGELFVGMETIGGLIKRYKSLLTASILMTTTPTIQDDWQEPLRYPLIS